jgi:hypothetical protein
MLTKETNENEFRLRRIFGLGANESILLAIIQAGENGISGNELVLRSGVSRITIWKLRVRLRNTGLIYYQTKGKRTTYYPTKLAINDFYFPSWIRCNELFRLLEIQDIPIFSPYYNIKFPSFDYKTERAFLEFVLRAGFLVTYMLVQHLGPNRIRNQQLTQRKSTLLINRLTEKSVTDIISPIKMLTIIRQSLYRLGHRFPISTAKKSDGYSFYEMEPKSYEEVVTALNNVFPQAAKRLQAINFEDAEERVKRGGEIAKKRKEQLKCKHSYRTNITDITERYYCSICDYKSEIDRDSVIGSREIVQKLNSIIPPTDTCRNHRWKVFSEIMPYVSFECSLCHKIAGIPIESEEILDAVREEVETDEHLDLKSSVKVCEDIQMFFHRHSNMKLTTNHYIKYYEQHQNKKKIVDFRAFTTEIETIFRILAKNGYIECITGKGVDKVTKYIRRENIDIKSVTDKKLLTLVAV